MTELTTERLEPCPFHEPRACGCEVKETARGNQPRAYVECIDCGARGPEVMSAAIAVSTWNRRAAPELERNEVGGEPVAWRWKHPGGGWLLFKSKNDAQYASRAMHGRIIEALGVIAAAPVSGVSVKPLEWQLSSAAERWTATHPFGVEEIVRDHRATSDTSHGWFSNGKWLWFRSLDEAKTAAQADYEACILSALTATSHSREGVVEEADREVAWVIESGSGEYWTGRSPVHFSGDHSEACRFSRQEDAERVRTWLISEANRHLAGAVRASEHVWLRALASTVAK